MKKMRYLLACFVFGLLTLFSNHSDQAVIESEETNKEQVAETAEYRKFAEVKKNAKDLFEEKCSICHSLDRPKSKMKTKDEWEITVMRMTNMHRAPVTEAQARLIIDYLAENYGKK
jgi:cytochrome c5